MARVEDKVDIVMPRKSILPSVLGVGAETATTLSLGEDVTPMHIATDMIVHMILNTFELKKFTRFSSVRLNTAVDRSRDALIHLFGKYGSHTLIDKLSHTVHHHAHHIHDHLNHHDISIITWPILMCLMTEQLYKEYVGRR